jgi:hypothetical protein
VRSHEVKDEGYLVEHDGKCITVFSAPNYCDQMGNKGAFIRFGKDMKPQFTQFTAVVRIYWWLCERQQAQTDILSLVVPYTGTPTDPTDGLRRQHGRHVWLETVSMGMAPSCMRAR